MGNFWAVPLLYAVYDVLLKTHTNDNAECLLRRTKSNYTYYLDNFILKETRHHFEDPDIDGRIILRCTFRKRDVGIRTGLIWLRIGAGGGRL